MEVRIDIPARLRLAELARHLATGRITNFEFDDAVPKSSDRSVHEIYFLGLWPLYDDLKKHRMTGPWKLQPEGREWVARIVLFLRSNLPYRYPAPGRWRWLYALIPNLITLGAFDVIWRRIGSRGSDMSVWPFYTKDEYELALRKPTFLSGPADA